MNPVLRHALLGACLASIVGSAATVRADDISDFYKGKTINLLIGVGVGGEYDTNARLTGRHIGKHIPGQSQHRRGSVKNGPVALPCLETPAPWLIYSEPFWEKTKIKSLGKEERRVNDP